MNTVSTWYEDATFARLLDAVPARPKSIAELREWVAGGRNPSSAFLFGIRPIGDETLAGIIEISDILWTQQVGWITLAIAPAEQKRGYGADALRCICRYAFDELNLRRLQLTVFSYNERAIALYEKSGFTREGSFREFLHRDGQLFDMHLYGLLAREWRNQA